MFPAQVAPQDLRNQREKKRQYTTASTDDLREVIEDGPEVTLAKELESVSKDLFCLLL